MEEKLIIVKMKYQLHEYYEVEISNLATIWELK